MFGVQSTGVDCGGPKANYGLQRDRVGDRFIDLQKDFKSTSVEKRVQAIDVLRLGDAPSRPACSICTAPF